LKTNRKIARGLLAHLPPCQLDGEKIRKIAKDSYRSHLGEKVATSTGKISEPKFRERVRKMEPVAEGSNPFLRGFKNPPFHLVALSLLF